ncbi:MAG: hypothetical protein HRF51_13050 [bacterium]|jgi:hypothetical protein
MTATKVKRPLQSRTCEDLLLDILIVQLAQAGLTQHKIRQVAKVDIRRVSRIAKHLKKTDPKP